MNAGEGEFVATTDRCGVPAKMEYKIYIYIYTYSTKDAAPSWLQRESETRDLWVSPLIVVSLIALCLFLING